MHKQIRKYWCGPASVQNALEALGTRVSQKKVAELCGTTEDGTSEHQIMEGLGLLGCHYSAYGGDLKGNAQTRLRTHLYFGDPIVLCIDEWSHWVTVVAPPLGPRFPVVDPVIGEVRLIHWKTLERRWRAAARLQTDPLDKTYYAISVRGPDEL